MKTSLLVIGLALVLSSCATVAAPGKYCTQLDKDFRQCVTDQVVGYEMNGTVQFYIRTPPQTAPAATEAPVKIEKTSKAASKKETKK